MIWPSGEHDPGPGSGRVQPFRGAPRQGSPRDTVVAVTRRWWRRAAGVVLAVAVWGGGGGPAAGQAGATGDGRVPLAAGPFGPLAGTELGEPAVFERPSVLPENPPVPTRCVPLRTAGGSDLGWLAAASVAGGQLYVRRCVVGAEPDGGLAPGARAGGEALEWERATLAPDGAALVTTPLGLPDWSFFSSPAFCDSLVAYWAMRGTDLFVQVYDLDQARTRASRPRGAIYLSADEADALEPPSWDAGCRRASFAASRLGSRVVVLELEP